MNEGYNPGLSISIILLFLVFYTCFHGFNAAVDSLSDSELAAYGSRKKKPERLRFIEGVLDDPRRFHDTFYLVTTVFGILTGFAVLGFAAPLYRLLLSTDLHRHFGSTALFAASLLLLILAAVLILAPLGIFIPHILGSLSPAATAFFFGGFVRAAMAVLRPLTALVRLTAKGILCLLGKNPDAVNDDVTEEDLREFLDEAHEQGVLLESEAAMMQNIIEFSDKSAKDIMIHRMNIVALDGSMTLKDAAEQILTESNSRFPVYQEDMDNIIGILHLREVLAKLNTGRYASWAIKDIPNLLRPVSMIPETRSIDALFRAMQSKKAHMVIVVDEYGQTSGLITMEDIIEEIVGNIFDEYDESEQFIVPLHDNSMLMDGLTPLEEAGAVLNVDFSGEEFETINGYLTSVLGHIPTQEDKEVRVKGYHFQILSICNNTIQKLKVEKL